MAGNENITNWTLGAVGAIVGGAIGYYVFSFLAGQDFYGMVIPGALLGLGCGLFSGINSTALGIACGFLAVILGIFTEWSHFPFNADDSFSYFITHIHKLKSTTLIMIAVGGIIGFWFGKGRAGGVGLRRGKSGSSD